MGRPSCKPRELLQRGISVRSVRPNYIQHNPNIPQGRDALQALVADLSQAVYYEPGLIVAEGDLVANRGGGRSLSDRGREAS